MTLSALFFSLSDYLLYNLAEKSFQYLRSQVGPFSESTAVGLN